MVADFIMWAKNNGIAVGPGRGPAAGSIVAHPMGITDLDPIPHGLIFERFLNPERVSMPDVDVDFGIGKICVILTSCCRPGQRGDVHAQKRLPDAAPRRRERHAELVAPGEQTLVKPVVNDDVLHVPAGMRHSWDDGTVKRLSPEPHGVDLARTAPGAGFVQLKHVVWDTRLSAGVVPGTDISLSVPAGSVMGVRTLCATKEPWKCGLCLAAAASQGSRRVPGPPTPRVRAVGETLDWHS